MPEQDFNNILNKVLGKNKEYNLIDVYHTLMVSYGYIPFEEFKKMDALLVDELMRRIQKMNESMKQKKRGR